MRTPVPHHLFVQLVRARDLVRAAYARPLTLQDLAREACMSPYHFLRSFRAVFGETPGRFLTRTRIDAAKAMLAAGATVTETCFAVGYASLGSFSDRFAKETGCPPSRWRTAPARVPSCFARRYTPRATEEKHADDARDRVRAEVIAG